MGFFDGFTGKKISEPVDAIGNAFDKMFTSDDERAQAEIILTKIKQQPQILQAEISKLEAQHRSTFVAGGRPAIIWVCAIGLAIAFVVDPALQWFGNDGADLPLDAMLSLVVAILGLGAMRTVEKIGGRAK